MNFWYKLIKGIDNRLPDKFLDWAVWRKSWSRITTEDHFIASPEIIHYALHATYSLTDYYAW